MSPLGHVTLSRRGAGSPVTFIIVFDSKKRKWGFLEVLHLVIFHVFVIPVTGLSLPSEQYRRGQAGRRLVGKRGEGGATRKRRETL